MKVDKLGNIVHTTLNYDPAITLLVVFSNLGHGVVGSDLATGVGGRGEELLDKNAAKKYTTGLWGRGGDKNFR